MEIEITYDDFLSLYPPLKTEFFKLIPKILQKDYHVIYRPPFLILSDDTAIFEDVDSGELLDLYDLLQEYEKINKTSFHLIKQTFYFVQYEDDFIMAKDGFDTGIMIFGPFTPKRIIMLGMIKDFKNKKYQFQKIMKGIKDNLEDFMQKYTNKL